VHTPECSLQSTPCETTPLFIFAEAIAEETSAHIYCLVEHPIAPTMVDSILVLPCIKQNKRGAIEHVAVLLEIRCNVTGKQRF
jgi:hypothetical protein